jgi:hypothetical protein
VRPEAEITVSEDGDDIDATVTAPGIAAISGPFVSATRYKITRDGPVAKFLQPRFEANSQAPVRAG